MVGMHRPLVVVAPPAPPPLATPPPKITTSHIHGMVVGLVASVAGILTIMAGALFYCLIRRKLIPYLNQRKASKENEKKSLKYDKIPLRCFDFGELEKATNNFSRDCLLGSGAFGNVYKGTFDIEGTLAIKRAHSESFLSVEEFRNEVRLLSKVKHKNLVGLVGYCEEPGEGGAKILVYEYVPNGSLLEYMMGKRERSLTWRQRVIIAIGAAKGIAYLHDGVKPSIIHRDIKPSNILLGEGFEAKVSDFGLVKSGPVGDQSHVSSQIKGTPGYLDPAYCSSFHLSTFSDVYSFGVILLQLISARPAVATTQHQSIVDWARPSLEKDQIEDIIDINLLYETCNMNVMQKMGQLALRCVVKVPKHRPTMAQVYHELEEALFSADNFINKQPSGGFLRSLGSAQRSAESGSQRSLAMENYDYSQSFVSRDGVGFQRFHFEMDSFSFRSASLRCLEDNSISIYSDMDSLTKIYEDETI